MLEVIKGQNLYDISERKITLSPLLLGLQSIKNSELKQDEIIPVYDALNRLKTRGLLCINNYAVGAWSFLTAPTKIRFISLNLLSKRVSKEPRSKTGSLFGMAGYFIGTGKKRIAEPLFIFHFAPPRYSFYSKLESINNFTRGRPNADWGG